MKRIVDVHFPNIQKDLVNEALEIFFQVRSVNGLKKKPSTSALSAWTHAPSAAATWTGSRAVNSRLA